MHEMALMGDILNIIQEDIQNRNFTKVTKVELIVGELSNAMPDALEMAFDIYKTDGLDISFLDKNSQLIIVKEKAIAQCTVCSEEYIPDHKLAFCPNCEIPTGRLISGETFKIKSYEGS